MMMVMMMGEDGYDNDYDGDDDTGDDVDDAGDIDDAGDDERRCRTLCFNGYAVSGSILRC